MTLIKNFDKLNKTPQRTICLELIDAALSSIQPQNIIPKNISLNGGVLGIQNKTFNLNNFDRVFLVGFGKGSAGLSKEIEKIIGNFLTKGFVIDLIPEDFSKIEFTKGTHPLPSENNFMFTKKTFEQLSNLTIKDLVLIVVAGGGSAMFVYPYKITIEKLIEINKSLLVSGADIREMNTVRKHLSLVKGGGLAKLLYPASIISVIASDVPGNDLSVIASAPTVKDPTTKNDDLEILKKYSLLETLNLSEDDFLETPKENMYFEKASNILLVSNQTALGAMAEKAKELGLNATILSDKFQDEAKLAGEKLIKHTLPHQILLAGGETTVKTKGFGIGGRNQELVLATLTSLDNQTLIASFDTDGWDNTEFAGAIGDATTLQKAKESNLNLKDYLETNNSFEFFKKTGDGIVTGHLASNVSDLIIVIKS